MDCFYAIRPGGKFTPDNYFHMTLRSKASYTVSGLDFFGKRHVIAKVMQWGDARTIAEALVLAGLWSDIEVI